MPRTNNREININGIKIYQVKLATWEIIIIFLLGMVIGELAPEPTDFIYFLAQHYQWIQDNIGLSVFIWYYLSASFYAILLVISIFLYKNRIGNPRIILYSIIILIALSAILSFNFIFQDIKDIYTTCFVIFTLIFVSIIGVFYVLGFRIGFSDKNQKGSKKEKKSLIH